MRLYRTVRHNPPEPSDFLSGEAEGRPPPRQERFLRFWKGFSTFDSLERAREKARENPRQGRYIAELVIPDDAGIEYEKSFSAGHYTVWGDPVECNGCVARTHLVWDEER